MPQKSETNLKIKHNGYFFRLLEKYDNIVPIMTIAIIKYIIPVMVEFCQYSVTWYNVQMSHGKKKKKLNSASYIFSRVRSFRVLRWNGTNCPSGIFPISRRASLTLLCRIENGRTDFYSNQRRSWSTLFFFQ